MDNRFVIAGRARWKDITSAQRSEAMRKLAIDRHARMSEEEKKKQIERMNEGKLIKKLKKNG